MKSKKSLFLNYFLFFLSLWLFLLILATLSKPSRKVLFSVQKRSVKLRLGQAVLTGEA